MTIVKEKAEAIVNSILAEETVANAKLEAAEPALRAAEEALNTIKGCILTIYSDFQILTRSKYHHDKAFEMRVIMATQAKSKTP